MIRKYHNHKLQTTPWHREAEPLNHHETPRRQIKPVCLNDDPRLTLIYLMSGSNLLPNAIIWGKLKKIFFEKL